MVVAGGRGWNAAASVWERRCRRRAGLPGDPDDAARDAPPSVSGRLAQLVTALAKVVLTLVNLAGKCIT